MPLLNALNHSNPDVRRYAVELLGSLGGEKVISSLVGTFQDAENSVVQAAFEALVQIGDDRAIQALLAALNDPNPELRRYAVESLGNFWGDEVIAGLVVAIYDEDDYVRRAAFDALVEIGDTEALYPYLNQSSSRNVYWALMRIGGEDVEEVLSEPLEIW